jgi:hypothetical protein
MLCLYFEALSMYKSVLGEEENTKFPLGVCHLLNWAISLVVYIGNLGKHRLDENSVTYLEQVTI